MTYRFEHHHFLSAMRSFQIFSVYATSWVSPLFALFYLVISSELSTILTFLQVFQYNQRLQCFFYFFRVDGCVRRFRKFKVTFLGACLSSFIIKERLKFLRPVKAKMFFDFPLSLTQQVILNSIPCFGQSCICKSVKFSIYLFEF